MKYPNKGTIIALVGDYRNNDLIGTAFYTKKFVDAVGTLDLDFKIRILSLGDIGGRRLSEPLRRLRYGRSPFFLTFRKILFAVTVTMYVMAERPRMILCLEELLSPLCYVLKCFFRTRYAVFAHCPQPWGDEKLRRSLTGAAWIVANSVRTKQCIMEKLHIPGDRFFIVYPYVDEKLFRPQERNRELIKKYNLDDQKVLLTVGRIDKSSLERKRQDIVIKAVSIVKKRIPNIKYLIVGPGDQRQFLSCLAEEYGVGENVIFTGGIQESVSPAYYNLCDLFVMPSKIEGFGMAYLEALACGKPAIGGLGTGAEEALSDGKLGLLVKSDEVDSLARVITDMLQGNVDPFLKNPEYLRGGVLGRFGIDTYTRRLEHLLETIMQKGNT